MFNKNKRATKVLAKFNKSKFNYNEFVRDFYLENNKAYISVKVNDYHEIISKFSIKDYEWLSDEFANYIQENAYYIPITYDIILEICGKFKKEEKVIITRTIKTYFGVKLGDAQIDLNINRKKTLTLLLFGFISLIIFLFLTIYIVDFKFIEPISILLWFLLWEVLDNFFLERSKLKEKKLEAAQLADMTVIFNEK